MLKNRIDYKLINLVLIAVLVYLIHKTGNLWIGILTKIFQVLTPFIISFFLAYAFYPLLKWFQSKGIKKGIAVFLVIFIILSMIALVITLMVPVLITQLSSLFTAILAFLKELSSNYDLNISFIQENLTNAFNKIMANLSEYVSDGALNAINVSINFFTIFFIVFSCMIYLLVDMGKIREYIKNYLLKKSHKTYNYVDTLDTEMKNYISGFIKIAIISFFEYTFAFFIIGHKHALLLGVLAMFGGLIPYFGGMLVSVIAAITAFVISPALFIKTIITFLVLSFIDGNVINPTVYGKTNKIHPVIVIGSVFIGGALLGVVGIIISLPVAIILIATYKFYEKDINNKINDTKKIKKKKVVKE